MLNIKGNYEVLKGSPNILVDYDEILSFYPTYYRDRTILANEKISMELREFYSKYTDAYKESNQYKEDYNKLKEEGLPEYDINAKLLREKLAVKWNYLMEIFYKSRNSAIELLDLIDYVGNYPTTYPVPTEEELNKEMEELLEKYDISVRYYMHDDLDKMKTTSDDVVRLIEAAHDRISCFQMIKDNIGNKEWMEKFITKADPDKLIESKEYIFQQLDTFPESNYQKQGKSKREEGKRYQKIYVENYNKCGKSQ